MQINLNGEWQYSPLSYTCICQDGRINESLEELPKPGKMIIPSNWEKAGLRNFSGRIEFSKEFEIDVDHMIEKQIFICCKGIDYFADIYLNDNYIGQHEGYFQPFEFDVTDSLQHRNKLTIIVNSPMEELDKVWPSHKKLIKGVLNHHDARPGGWHPQYGQSKNTGGIWNDVYLDIRPKSYIDHVKWLPTVLPDGRAKVVIETDICCGRKDNYQLAIQINDDDEKCYNLELNNPREHKAFVISFDKPNLWWTWDLGDPYLYQCKVTLRKEHKDIHSKAFQAGIRNVSYNPENGQWTLNNKSVFLRGTNIIPTQWLSEYDGVTIAKDIKLMREAHVNSVRVHAHVTRDEFYTACDQAGLLVWQDFALQWSYDSSDTFATNAVSQIKDMVNYLYNHPSIGIWCCHNEPSINTEELDPLLKHTVMAMDHSRYVHASSDFREHPYPGWYFTSVEDYRTKPSKPLVSEFGAQAMPNKSIAEAICGEQWPPNWEKMLYHNFQYDETFNVAKVPLGDNLDQFISNSQNYQAQLLKFAIEHYRLDKYKNLGSIYQFMFVDCWPSITWSVVDYNRQPKKGYGALMKAYQPLLPILEIGRNTWSTGKQVELKLYVINDYHKQFTDYSYRIRLCNKHEERFLLEGKMTIEPDSVGKITKYRYGVEHGLSAGYYNLMVEVLDQHQQVIAMNDYLITIADKPPYQEHGLVFDE